MSFNPNHQALTLLTRQIAIAAPHAVPVVSPQCPLHPLHLHLHLSCCPRPRLHNLQKHRCQAGVTGSCMPISRGPGDRGSLPRPSSRGTQVRLLLAQASPQGHAAAPAVFRLKQPPASPVRRQPGDSLNAQGLLTRWSGSKTQTCITCIVLGRQPALGLQPESSLKCF